MLFENTIASGVVAAFKNRFNSQIDREQLSFQMTRKDFEGDITLVVFNLSKLSGMPPDKTAEIIGEALLESNEAVSGFNVVKGFLNISIHGSLFLNELHNSYQVLHDGNFALYGDKKTDTVLIEYSSPNTNKPLHLGHIRNNLLGYSLSQILSYTGNKVVKVNIVNDRGIHICKSMVAWKNYSNGETPDSSGLKGDHLVGKYYVEFDKQHKVQIKQLESAGMSREDASRNAPIMEEARTMLQKWESGDKETLELWETMNNWVYRGFDETYRNLGVDFDKIYYESKTYLLGKAIVEEGLTKKVMYRREDGSVWIDLRDEGLDEKLLLRSDGTSVYMTQDLGTAVMRYNEFKFDKLVYVVGNEQDYHFKVLFIILRKLGYNWADRLFHLSYNMVDLPSGKMKSREGTVVDADELITEMVEEAKKLTLELGKVDEFSNEEANRLFNMLGLGALKYFILKVDPEKRMLFNPDESIDFNGHTGPFIQYTHARIRSVIRKGKTIESLAAFEDFDVSSYSGLIAKEKELVKVLLRFRDAVHDSAAAYSPAVIANYAYELAKSYNQFYHDHPIIDPANTETSLFRLSISHKCSLIIAVAMRLLGISVPERM